MTLAEGSHSLSVRGGIRKTGSGVVYWSCQNAIGYRLEEWNLLGKGPCACPSESFDLQLSRNSSDAEHFKELATGSGCCQVKVPVALLGAQDVWLLPLLNGSF